MIEIRTPRLRLVAGTLELVEADLSSREALAGLLGCETPPDWPPPLNDEDSARFFLSFAKQNPDAIGWGLWYLLRGSELVGSAGFKGKPLIGRVEIGYSIVPRFHRAGFATEAVGGLLAWAFSHDDVQKVIAHTLPLPDGEASMGVLRKAGFTFVGEGEEEGAVMFELQREDWRRRHGPAPG